MLQTTRIKPPDYHSPHNIITQTSSGSDSGLRDQHSNNSNSDNQPNSWYTTSSLTSSESSGHVSPLDHHTLKQQQQNNEQQQLPLVIDTTDSRGSRGQNQVRCYSPDTATINSQSESVISQTAKSLLRRAKFWKPQSNKACYLTDSQSSSMTSVTAFEYPDKEYVELQLPIARYGCLGITVIGQTTPAGHDVGIYCGGIQAASAAGHFDNAIEPGDRIISVDGEDLRCMTNDTAVASLQRRISLCLQPGSRKISVKMGFAKYIDRDSDAERNESLEDDELEAGTAGLQKQPINPAEWVKNHSDYYNRKSMTGSHSDSSSSIISSTEPENSVIYGDYPNVTVLPPLSIQTSMIKMIKVANTGQSGLKIKDREWLGLVIPLAFLGADLVDWLHDHVEGLEDRRDAKQYASTLFKGALIKPTIQANARKFSEKSYYKF